MKLFQILALTVLLPGSAVAQPAEPLTALEAQGLTEAEFLWFKRPLVVFADTAEDPLFARQIELLAREPAALRLRDVVVIVDTDPAAKTAFREKLRPRGFSMVILDKDGSVEIRKPRPWTVREITAAIDKFPLARVETLERFPAGR